jgi:hypothetical protein
VVRYWTILLVTLVVLAGSIAFAEPTRAAPQGGWDTPLQPGYWRWGPTPDRRIRVQWGGQSTAGVYLLRIEIARAPYVDNDGFNASDIADLGDFYPGTASPVDWASGVLEHGTYYVVLVYRNEDWYTDTSDVKQVVIEPPAPPPPPSPLPVEQSNRSPRITGRFFACCEMLTVRARVCDGDGPAGGITFHVRQSINPNRLRVTRKRFPAPWGCQRYEFSIRFAFLTAPIVRTVVWVTDSTGAKSNNLRKTWR